MKVFTSIFVLEGERATVNEIDASLRAESVHSEMAEVMYVSRRQVVNLHVMTELRRDGTGDKA